METFLKKHQHILSILVPCIVGIIYVILCSLNLTSSIWFDESYSAYLSRGSFGDIWHLTSMDVHPPFFYFALKIWSLIFGTSDFAMRFMSVFFGAISIVFIFQLVKRKFGIKSAIFATIAVGLSPMLIRYGQEMRMYTMVLAIVSAATYVLDIALTKNEKKYWVIYAILVSIGMWTHYFSALLWITELAIIIHHFGGIKKLFKDKTSKNIVLMTYGLAVALYIPWVPSFIKQICTVQSGFWVPAVSARTFIDYLSNMMLYEKSENILSWFALLEIVSVITFILMTIKVVKNYSKREKQSLAYLAEIAILPVCIMFILSLPPLRAIFVDRYVLYSIVFSFVIIGVIFALSKEKKLNIFFAILFILTSSFGIFNVENREPSGYVKSIISKIYTFDSVSKDDSTTILANSVWTYYDAVFYGDDTHKIYFPENWTQYEYGSLEPIRTYRVNLTDNLDTFLSEHQTFWYIVDAPSDGKDAKLPDEFKGFEISDEISDEHHVAMKVSKNNS